MSVHSYLFELLSDENQFKIASALKAYDNDNVNRIDDFNQMITAKIAEKQKQYDALMSNLSAGTLPPKIVADIGNQMQTIQDEIEALSQVEPPQDYISDTIQAWLESIKNAPDERIIHILIERIDVKNKTEFNITSTLNSVLCENGLSGGI